MVMLGSAACSQGEATWSSHARRSCQAIFTEIMRIRKTSLCSLPAVKSDEVSIAVKTKGEDCILNKIADPTGSESIPDLSCRGMYLMRALMD